MLVVKSLEKKKKEERMEETKKCKKKASKDRHERKQGWIHGNPVADGWAGAVMRKPLGIQKCDRSTDGPIDRRTDRQTDGPTDTARCRVACPRLKTENIF